MSGLEDPKRREKYSRKNILRFAEADFARALDSMNVKGGNFPYIRDITIDILVKANVEVDFYLARRIFKLIENYLNNPSFFDIEEAVEHLGIEESAREDIIKVLKEDLDDLIRDRARLIYSRVFSYKPKYPNERFEKVRASAALTLPSGISEGMGSILSSYPVKIKLNLKGKGLGNRFYDKRELNVILNQRKLGEAQKNLIKDALKEISNLEEAYRRKVLSLIFEFKNRSVSEDDFSFVESEKYEVEADKHLPDIVRAFFYKEIMQTFTPAYELAKPVGKVKGGLQALWYSIRKFLGKEKRLKIEHFKIEERKESEQAQEGFGGAQEEREGQGEANSSASSAAGSASSSRASGMQSESASSDTQAEGQRERQSEQEAPSDNNQAGSSERSSGANTQEGAQSAENPERNLSAAERFKNFLNQNGYIQISQALDTHQESKKLLGILEKEYFNDKYKKSMFAKRRAVNREIDKMINEFYENKKDETRSWQARLELKREANKLRRYLRKLHKLFAKFYYKEETKNRWGYYTFALGYNLRDALESFAPYFAHGSYALSIGALSALSALHLSHAVDTSTPSVVPKQNIKATVNVKTKANTQLGMKTIGKVSKKIEININKIILNRLDALEKRIDALNKQLEKLKKEEKQETQELERIKENMLNTQEELHKLKQNPYCADKKVQERIRKLQQELNEAKINTPKEDRVPNPVYYPYRPK